ncbi:MAG: DUF3048 domain-containing protein [Lachnospiraceae bacterium]|nr:DUF3048 domain-containing protein [Lachnospiraceae bacterium]
MKKRLFQRGLSAVLMTALVLSAYGCGKSPEPEAAKTEPESSIFEPAESATTEASAEEPVAEEPAEPVEEEPLTVPDGMYLSELSGLPISESLKSQRPITVMVDNELDALPHFGTAQADIIYEMMNSTANNRITRLMAVVKDWEAIEQLGSIRSTRPTNIMLSAEYNAVLCHDGGPYHNDAYFAKGFIDHFSGTFSRVNNGKKREFTEYILTGDLDRNFDSSKASREYAEGFSADTPHFNFVEYGKETDLASLYERTYNVKQIILPFEHNGSVLNFNDNTKCYEYYEYNEQHLDEDSGEPLAFTNVFLQDCSFTKLDENGYLVYNCLGSGTGFYITNGIAKSVSWVKNGEQDFTRFYDDNGDEIVVNRGKTYIALVPDDSWDKVIMGETAYVPE